jgi:multidrug efflux pump subunit AcrB
MVDFLIKRPVSVTMSVLALVILGAVVSVRLPVSMMPPVDIPEILLKVEYPNYTAVEMEKNISRQLILQLQTVNQLESVEANSRDGASQIRLRFAQDADVEYALIDVYQKIDNAMSYFPKDMEYPSVVKARPTDLPVFYINIYAEETKQSPAKTAQLFLETSTLVRTVIREKIAQLEAVAMTDMTGYTMPRIILRPHMDKMASLGIPTETIETLLEENNNARGTIKVMQGFYEYDMSFAGTLENLKDIEGLVLLHNKHTFQLKELADITLEPRPRNGISLFNQTECVSIGVIKRDNAKMEDLREQVQNRIVELEVEFPGLAFEITQDQTSLLRFSINNLKQSLYLGIVLALLIMFLFVKDSRTPWLMVVSLPVSLIIAIFFFYLAKLSINIISLSGLLLGVGMMIDNSIIVLDNISQRQERGESLSSACINGTNEIVTPLLSSVLTTCAIFVPLIFISGIAGTLFFDQAIAVTIGLFVSYFVSIMVLPVYYKLFHSRRARGNFLEKVAIFSSIEQFYERWLIWFFRRQYVLWIVCITFLLAGAGTWKLIDRSLLPAMSHKEVIARIDWAVPIPVEENKKRVQELILHAEPLLLNATSLSGADMYLLSRDAPRDASQSKINFTCKSEKELEALKAQTASYLAQHYPSAQYRFSRPMNILEEVFGEQEAPLTARIRLNAYANEEESLHKIELIRKQLEKQFPGQVFAAPAVKKRYLVSMKEDLIQAYGIDKREIRNTIQVALQNHTAFNLTSFSVTYPVIVGGKQVDFLQALNSAMVRKTEESDGEKTLTQLPLSDFISVSEGLTMKEVLSDQNGRYFPFPFEVEAREKNEYEHLIMNSVVSVSGARVDFSGSIDQTEKQNREILIIIGISIILLYFILAAQFNSVFQPFIVLLELPIDIGAGLLFLFIFGQTVNVMALIGIVVMCGIVINDSIIKIDTINRLRKEGYSVIHAVLTAGVRRLKPILMTSLTTILSLMPFLIFQGIGNEMQRPLAVVLTGGLGIGTFVSLFFIPLAYFYVNRKRT